MLATLLHAPHDIRSGDLPPPRILKPWDAILRLPMTCICGSDLWSYRGISKVKVPARMGHEYCGIVEEVGSAVRTIKPGQFVVGSFFASDGTCAHCKAGYHSSCENRQAVIGAQAERLRVPWADGTLVPTPGMPPEDLIPSLLALSDVMGTGWFAADAAEVKPKKTVAVVGDGAVGLLGVLSARQKGAERIIIMSRHPARQALAREFGATDIVTERGEEGVERVRALTKGVGAGAGRRRAVLLPCTSAWRSRAGAAVPARAHRPGVEPEDRARQGLRPHLALGPGGRRLQGHG